MNIEKLLKDNTIIICEYNKKVNLLKKFSKESLLNISFYSLKEIREKLLFSYNYKAVYYLMDKYGFNYDVSYMYINNMYYVEDKKYQSEKLNTLVYLKKELDENNLLIYDEIFKIYLKDKTVIVYGYNYLKKEELNLLEKLKCITKVNVVNDIYQKNNITYYEFKTMEEEVSFVASKISELLNKKIPIDKIKIANYDNSYYNTITKIFSFYNLPINILNTTLLDTSIAKMFLDNLNLEKEELIDLLNNNFKDDILINKIVNILNKYIMEDDLLKIKDFIKEDLKREIITKEYENAISIINLEDIEDEYVFVINCNQTILPRIYKDEEYITDNIKEEVNMSKSYEINKMEKEKTTNILLNNKNTVITYKLKDLKNIYFPSVIFEDEHFIKKEAELINKFYSYKMMQYKTIKSIDNLLNYGEKNENIDYLYSNFYDESYRKYDNSFSGISTDSLYNYLDNKLTLSYSSLESYNECHFKYYIDKILKLNQFDETFYTIIGNVFHYILQIGLFEDIDVYEKINEYLKDKKFNNKEEFFKEKLIKELIFILQEVRLQTKDILLDNYLFEKEIIITKESKLHITFKGFIDKIIYSDNPSIAVLVDYKTGNPNINLNYLPNGLNMQLPIYLYLASYELKDVKFAGFYLQKLLDPTYDAKKTIDEMKKDGLKLEGYTNSDIEVVKYFDKNFSNSNIVKGLKMSKNNEFYKSSKTLSSYEIEKVIELTKNCIDKSISSIEDANFIINPKIIGLKNNGFNSCAFCKFSDICYKKQEDITYLEEIKDLKFLDDGGDTYA